MSLKIKKNSVLKNIGTIVAVYLLKNHILRSDVTRHINVGVCSICNRSKFFNAQKCTHAFNMKFHQDDD